MPGNSLFLSFLLSSALFVSSLVPAALQSSATVIHKLPEFVSSHGNHPGSATEHRFYCSFEKMDLHPWEPPHGAEKVTSSCDSHTRVNTDAPLIFSETIQASDFFFVTKGLTEQ